MPPKKSFSFSFAGEKQAKLFQIVYDGFLPPEADITCPLGYTHRLDINLGNGRKENFGKIQFACQCRSVKGDRPITWASSPLGPDDRDNAEKQLKTFEQEMKTRQKVRKQPKEVNDKHADHKEGKEAKLVTNGEKSNKGKAKDISLPANEVSTQHRIPEPFPMSPPVQRSTPTPGPSSQIYTPTQRSKTPVAFPTPPATSPIKGSHQKRYADTTEYPQPAKRQKTVMLEPIELTDTEEENIPDNIGTHSSNPAMLARRSAPIKLSGSDGELQKSEPEVIDLTGL
ncbi:hypothetical protein K435DRAFT_807071 [Dendrothele bispora CBS 962.96]|uniref:Uncharacterized protein n=1 Tax=Dendrothele bispora (strain CBS 962.96) TaxID=1314807 RepID=A0A4S8L5X2_DENBC|nr:hypothetical protein K435DRAFT_807071 [Dendrothele bispora CBS 962.96]